MEAILQGLMELAGVSATMVLDGAGHVVAHRGRAVYDRATCEHVGGPISKAVESIQLQQDDWESISAQFADGKILLRKLGAGANNRKHVLAVVADATLNTSFATVAIRVAANKLRSALDGGAGLAETQPGSSAPPPLPASSARLAPAASSPLLAPAPAAPAPADSRPLLANTGLSWTKSSNLGSSAGGISGVTATDAASSAFLTRCAKELARHVGPMSKVYVQEAVRRVAADAPFSLSLAGALVDDLAGQVEDAKDRVHFVKALQKT